MTGSPADERRPSCKPVLSRPLADSSDKELEEWAEAFVEAVLGRSLDLEPTPPEQHRAPD